MASFPEGDHSCAPYLSFLTSRCFSWTSSPCYCSPRTTVTPLSMVSPHPKQCWYQCDSPNISSVEMEAWLCERTARRRLFVLQGGPIRHAERELLKEFGWKARSPTARLQFLNFFYPERVLLNRENCFTFVPLSELTPESFPLQTHFDTVDFKAASLELLEVICLAREHLSSIYWELGKRFCHRVYQMLRGITFLWNLITFRLPLSKSFFCLLSYCGNISISWVKKIIILRFEATHVNLPELFFYYIFFIFISNYECLFSEKKVHPPSSILLYKMYSEPLLHVNTVCIAPLICFVRSMYRHLKKIWCI